MASGSEPTADDLAALGGPRPLVAGEAEDAARSIARAFAWHEPWGEWAMPDPGDREQRIYERMLADVRNRFLLHGEASTIGTRSTTLWIPPHPPGTGVFASRRSESDYATYGPIADAMRAGDELIAALKPDEEHWYLDTIATDPDWFGLGLAGRLLANDLARRDDEGSLSALDTHTPRQVAYYERFGFVEVGRGQLAPGLEVVMMLREPRRASPPPR